MGHDNPTTNERARLIELLRAGHTQALKDQERDAALAALGRGHSIQRQATITTPAHLDLAMLQQRLAQFVDTNPLLSYRMLTLGGGLVAVPSPAPIPTIHRSRANDHDQLERLLTEDLVTPLDGKREPGLRVSVIHSAQMDTLVVTMSSFVADDWTPSIVAEQLLDATVGAPGPDLQRLVATERKTLEAPQVQARLARARAELVDLLITDLTMRPRPEVLSQSAGSVARTATLSGYDDAVGDLAAAALAVVAGGLSHESRFGMLTRVRPNGLRWDPGPLAGSTVIPIDLTQHSDGASLVAAIRGARLEAAEGPAVPLAVLVEAVDPSRDLAHTPLAQIAFLDATELPATQGTSRSVARGSNQTDLTLVIDGSPDVVTLRLDYNADLFEVVEATAILNRIARVAESLAGGLDRPLREVPLLLDGEREELLALGQGNPVEAHPYTSLAALLREAATTHADTVALRFSGDDYTYRQLEAAAAAISAQLVHDPANRPVAILMKRSPLQVAAMLACVWCGRPFVPIDHHYPSERKAFMLEDADCSAIVHDGSVEVPPGDIRAIRVGPEAFNSGGTLGAPNAHPDSTAYVIYTSGSTGRPKGVGISQASVVNNCRWRQRVFPLTPGDAVLQNHSFSFDPSIWAVFWPLTVGCRIVLTEDSGIFNPTALVALVARERVTVLGGVPSVLSVLADEPGYQTCAELRVVLSGAEPLTADLVDKLRRHTGVTVGNLYGPTETTIDATYWTSAEPIGPGGHAPIGRAIDGASVRVLDSERRLSARGARGELFLGGAGLAVGYVGNPAETARRFITWEGPNGPERLYATGDLARWNAEGQLVFCGRVDDQVKIRGFRVELGEIEAVANALEDVSEFVAVARPAPSGEKRLVGYFTWAGEARAEADIRASLKAALPGHMVPVALEALAHIPRLPNGKTDRAALTRRVPQVEAEAAVNAASRGGNSTVLLDVRSEFVRALGIDGVSADTDFFEAGGSSIMLATLASRLRLRYDIEIPIHEIFQVPTPRGVTTVIDQARQGGIDEILAGRHMERIKSDAILDADIRRGDLPESRIANPRLAFLTGATGYLGCYILSALLHRTSMDVWCLVRGSSEDDARRRLIGQMREYGLWDSKHDTRVRVLRGDLSLEQFGLDHDLWDMLAEEVDVIYHNGALVNFVYPYAALHAVNVEGTRRILRLATTRTIKAVHHVSTIDSILATHTPRPFLEDDRPLTNPVAVPGGYTGTKWVAEKLANTARERGLPVSIYRPGLILGAEDTGATQTSDYLLVALRGFLPMGMMPDYPRIFDTVPVTYVGISIVEISRRPESLGRFFHFFNPEPVSIRRFCEWIQEFGFKFDIVPFEIAREAALNVGEGHPLYALVPLIRDAVVDPQPSLDPRFVHELRPDVECANTLTFLQGSDVTCAPMTREYAWRCLQYLVDIGFLPAPDRDRAALATQDSVVAR